MIVRCETCPKDEWRYPRVAKWFERIIKFDRVDGPSRSVLVPRCDRCIMEAGPNTIMFDDGIGEWLTRQVHES